jgi:SAM-dependent methyltransferase
VPIAFYGARPDAAHWTDHWGLENLDRLLAVAEHDPLSGHLASALPRTGMVFEGGCGLGQYVLYLRRKGYSIIGGDFSLGALMAHRRLCRESPLVAMDLRALPFAAGVIAAHISLGVVEHLEKGPDMIVSELARTLDRNGVALVSVPWVNGLRRILRPVVERRERMKREAGMSFYQYAYTRHEIREFLGRVGLRVVRFHPYNPGRLFRQLGAAFRAANVQTAPWLVRRRSRLRTLLSRGPVLELAAHMILAVAVKE